MRIDDIQELFVQELTEIHAVERLGAELLPQLADECDHPDIIAALELHAGESRMHIKNLEQVCKVLDTRPSETQSLIADAIADEHDRFVRDSSPSATSLTMFNLGIAARLEHYEVAVYKGLVQKAGLLGEVDCEQLLREILLQEQQMARTIEGLKDTLGRQLVDRVLV